MPGSPPHEGPVSRYLNRPLSRRLARLLAATPITPNQVSVASLLLAAGAFAAFVADLPIPAGILVHASSVMDGVDGDLARLRGAGTRFGAVFDASLDRYADAFVIGGMTWWSAEQTGHPAPATLGLAALSLALLVSYMRARGEASAPGTDEVRAGIGSRDVRLLMAAIGSVAGQAYWTLWALAVLSAATLLYRFARLWLRLRSEGPMSQQGAATPVDRGRR